MSKTLSFIEAMQALERGERVHVLGDLEDEYCELKNRTLVNSQGASIEFGSDMFDYKFEIYKEPKPKKEVWQWRIKPKHSRYWYVLSDLMPEDDVSDQYRGYNIEKHAGPFEVGCD